MIRILLVDAKSDVQEWLRVMFERELDLELVGTASDFHTAIPQVRALEPDVMLIDREMPGLDGASATQSICQAFPDIKVLVLNIHGKDDFVTELLRSGAMGFLLKNTPVEDLKEAIRSVHKGYVQMGPGLLGKIVSDAAEQSVKSKKASVKLTEQGPSKIGEPSFPLKRFAARQLAKGDLLLRTENSWKRYLVLWLIINAFIWSAGLLYLIFKSPTYTSSWTINLPGTKSSADISLPGIGQATSSSESPYSSSSDPRENYKDLAKTDETLEAAASQLNIPVKEFGKPQIKIVVNTTLMKFEIQGDTPDEAQEKAFALHSALATKLNQLRKQETDQQDHVLEAILRSAEQRLQAAQRRLSAYQTRSGLISGEQLRNLSTNIEQLRQQQAETTAQLYQTSANLKQVSTNLGSSPHQAAEAFVLQSDPAFRQYLADYSKASAESTNLSARFSSNHPAIIDKLAERSEAQAALYQRGRSLLGRAVTQATLKQLNVNDSNSSNSQRASLFQELISLQGQQRGLRGKSGELGQQIAHLETRLSTQSQKNSKLANLERDVRMAEAVFSSTLTRLDLSKSTISAAYPLISVFTDPNLPKEPSSPQRIFVLLGMGVFSLFSATGMISLWLRNRKINQPNLNGLTKTTHQLDSLNSISGQK